MGRAFGCCVAVLLAAAVACERSPAASAPTAPLTPISTAAPDDPGRPGILITWGKTLIYVLYSTAGASSPEPHDTLALLANFVKRLGEGRAAVGSMRIFYTSTRPTAAVRDPSQAAWNGPFLDAMAPLGAIDFGLPSRVDLSSYTVVIFDPCEIMRWTSERDVVRDHIARGGRALVLGDNFCWDGTIRSREYTNVLLADYGISFTSADPNVRTALVVPPNQQTGVFTGVAQISIFRVTPQVISSRVVPLVKDGGGNILAALAAFNPR